jgi:hypothetical protein
VNGTTAREELDQDTDKTDVWAIADMDDVTGGPRW